MKSKYYIYTVFVIFLLLHPAVSNAKVDGTNIFISNFEGPKHLGKNVAALMCLEIGHKLQGSDIYKSTAFKWKVSDNKISNHQQALEAAKRHNASFILWGYIFHYGKSFIIQPYLSIPKQGLQTDKGFGVWQEIIKTKNQNFTITTVNQEINPVNRQMVFSPLILNPQIAQKYSSPHALRLYSEEKNRIRTDYLNDEFIILKFKGRSAEVNPEGKVGLFDLPLLSAQENEVFNFVAGILMLFVNDWSAGIERLQSSEQIKGTPTALKIDSLLFQADAKVKSGFRASPILEKAYSINPYYKPTIAYKIVNEFSELNRLLHKQGKADEKRKAILSIAKFIESNRYLFSINDEWFENVKSLSRTLEEEYSPSPIPINPVVPSPVVVNPPITPIEPDSSQHLWTADKQANIKGKGEVVGWVRSEKSRFVRVFISRNAIQMDENQIQLVFRGNKIGDYFISMVSIAQKKQDGKIGEVVESTWEKIYFDSKEKKPMWDNKILVPPLSSKISKITPFEFSKNADYYVTFFIEGPSDFLRYHPEEESASEKKTSLVFDFYAEKQDKIDYAEKKNWLYDESVDTDYTIIALDSIVRGYDTIQPTPAAVDVGPKPVKGFRVK